MTIHSCGPPTQRSLCDFIRICSESCHLCTVNKCTFSSFLNLSFLFPKEKSSPMQSLIISIPFPGGEWVDDLLSASVSSVLCFVLQEHQLAVFPIFQRATKQTSSCLPFALRGARKLGFCCVLLSSGLMGYKRGSLTKTSGKDLPTSLLLKTTLTQDCIKYI